ncbi:flagellar export chaperone FliS [Alkalilimnicola sp. S0819]|uniref:flagellar export chaperone FliS n=1 Tax=Alkalilimnicola sp. S0819 TaxID=2613922 RepID=UPI0012617089|nr:flagellar export chaperone FliS [Alkalilimnicola sp. S0819]KAB7627392.1 flagellar export chaperone FliS [Alkalilimnicola sp. S0819]MPQ15898.1 flagellar export chaperone FliS [Alkalilimnicola sp. S0819]
MYGKGINQYQQVGKASAEYADPHQLVQMLFEGALSRVAQAKGFIAHNDVEQRFTAIDKAYRIIDGLRLGLDKQSGGELAGNLDDLYEYIQDRLSEANARNAAQPLDEVISLLREIKSGWDEIPVEARGVKSAPLSAGQSSA